MSLFRKAGRMVLWAGAGAGLYFGSLGVMQALRIDAFRSYRNQQGGLGGDIGIRLEDVRFRHYSGSKLVAEGQVGQINVKKDRQNLEFLKLRNVRYSSGRGEFKCEADAASYDSVAGVLTMNAGSRVWNENIDLVTPQLVYNRQKKLLTAPGQTQGKFYDGTVVAQNIVYNVDHDSYRIGPASWEGVPKGVLQDVPVGNTRTQWKIKTNGITSVKDGIETWENAEATDGDVIVKAPKIVRDTKTDALTATGRVQYFSADANLVCDKCVIFRKEKRALLTGNVQMLIKPETDQAVEVIEIPPFRPMVPETVSKERPPAPPVDDVGKSQDEEVRSGKTKRKYPIAVLAAKIEYWYKKGNRKAVITGSPQARQDMAGGRWRAVWTTTAYYDGENDLLRLVSAEGKKTTQVKTSIGDDLICEWFEISTKENEDAWTAKGAQGVVYPDEDELPDRTKTKTPPPLKGKIGKV